MKIYLRADGNKKVGFGHLTRMLAFAQALFQSFDIFLITKELPEYFKKEFQQNNVGFILLNSTDDTKSEIQQIADHLLADDIIIIDGYQFDHEYCMQLRSRDLYIIKVSDYVEKIDGIDVLINHGGSVKMEDYPTTLNTLFYMGPNYSLIRKAFTQQNNKTEHGRILLCLGGTANDNDLKSIIKELIDLQAVNQVDVISSFLPKESYSHIHFHSGVSENEMALLMSKSELVICPASSLSYEAATVHTGLIVGILADNQKGQYDYLIKNNLAIGIGDFNNLDYNQFKGTVAEYLETGMGVTSIAHQKQLFDRKSLERLKKIIDKSSKVTALKIRRAEESDIDLLYEWVTDKIVRQNAINTRPIKFDDHKKWVKSVLNDINRELYIISYNALPMAQIRFDIERELATLSYSIASSNRGKGFGEAVVRKGIDYMSRKRLDVKKIKAVVQEENLPSNKVFESCNFAMQETEIIEGKPFNIYYKG